MNSTVLSEQVWNCRNDPQLKHYKWFDIMIPLQPNQCSCTSRNSIEKLFTNTRKISLDALDMWVQLHWFPQHQWIDLRTMSNRSSNEALSWEVVVLLSQCQAKEPCLLEIAFLCNRFATVSMFRGKCHNAEGMAFSIKGAVCKNWPAVRFILKTDRGSISVE